MCQPYSIVFITPVLLTTCGGSITICAVMWSVNILQKVERAIFRWETGIVFAMLFVIPMPMAPAQDDEKPVEIEWTESDTKLANHYIQLLQQKPEYGSVLDLLWSLYDKKGQTKLLLEYIGNAAQAKDADSMTLMIYGHLLRKNNDLDAARNFYAKVLATESANPIALKAAAEIADRQRRDAKALSLYTRAMAVIGIDSEDGVVVRMRKAALHRELGQVEKAVEIWDALLTAYPGNVQLRTEVVAFLLQAGETDTAVRVLRDLADQAAGKNPQQQLSALMELNRLYEFVNDFDGALKTAQEGLGLVHFKNHQHKELFTKLVRLHERFGRLRDLEMELKTDAAQDRPSEQAVVKMTEFYRLTAAPEAEEEWVKRLSELVPANVDYRVRHAMICMDNDRYDNAADILDRLLEENPQAPFRFTLLRCQVALNAEGRETAEAMLSRYLADKKPDAAGRAEILKFAHEYYLDGIVEEMLRGQLDEPETESAPVRLARFLQERGRNDQAIEALKSYVNSAGEVKTDRARRLHEVSGGFRDMKLLPEAMRAIDEAIRLFPKQPNFHLAKAEIFMDQKALNLALERFEKVRRLTAGLEKKSEIDQRIFSVLRGIVDKPTVKKAPILPTGVIQNIEQYRKAAAAASRGRREADEPPPKELTAFYGEIIATANTNPTLEMRYRAGWWAFKMQDTQECFNQLTKAKAEAKKPIVEVEKLLLEMAVQLERPTFQARHLQTLAEIDSENKDDYLQQWAEIRFLLGFEDEAIRTLKALAAKPKASLNTLKTLAKTYQRLGSHKRQIAVWQDAYRRANLFEKRQIIKQLTTVLVHQRLPEEALKIQLDLIQRDTDPIQKRRQFDTQLTLAKHHFLLPWLRDKYEELTRAKPFDRFFPEALAKIHRIAGDEKLAFEAMKKAYYMSGHDRDLLIQLGEMADHSDDLKAAIYYRRQLIAHSEKDASIESWNSLIIMLEKDLRLNEADLIRRRLESKFGQDTDFLDETAAYYRSSGQTDGEIRVLEKLVDLRPWDTKNRLALGLAKRNQADFSGALRAFNEVISRTPNTAIKENLQEDKIDSLTFLPITNSQYSGIDNMQSMIERFPFLPINLQKEIIEWLSKAHPEFDRVPAKPALIHLRAIEAAGRIIARRSVAERSEWVSRWKRNETATATEKLWAYHYSGAGDEAFELVKLHLGDSKNPLAHVWFSYLSVLGNQDQSLLKWVGDDPQYREIYPIVALFLITANQGADERFPERFDDYLRKLPVSHNVGNQLFKELQAKKDFAAAFRVGRILGERSLADNGDFHYLVSGIAGVLGFENQRIQWLNSALDLMREGTVLQLPTYYTSTISELYEATESATEKQALFQKNYHWTNNDTNADIGVNLLNRIYLETLAGRTDGAIEAIPPLWEHMLRETTPTGNIDTNGETERLRWTQLRSQLRFTAERLDLSPSQAIKLDKALQTGTLSPALSEEGQAELEEYESERIALFLENLEPNARPVPLHLTTHRMADLTGRILLARTLDSRGFRRESMNIYRADALENPGDYSILRGFLNAATAVGDPLPALDLIERYLTHGTAIPAGMQLEDIKRYRANFLYQLRDIERLSQLSQLEDLRPTSQTTPAIPYHNALARAYEKTGNEEALLRLLKHMREQKSASKPHFLTGARLLKKRGDSGAALEWLREIKLNRKERDIEEEAILEMIALAEDEKSLSGLMRKTEDYFDPELSISVAERLTEMGFETEARSALIHQARKSIAMGSDARSRLLAASLRLDLKSKKRTFAEIEPTLKQLLDSLRNTPSRTADFIALVKNHGTEKWKPFLEAHLHQPETRIVAWVSLSYLNSQFDPTFANNLSPTDFDHLLESLIQLGESGEKAAVTFIENHTSFLVRASFAGDAQRQITFFAALNDRRRLTEIYARLMQETASDRFNQRGDSPRFPVFGSRWHLARAFEKAGYSDLAAALFRRYDASIRRVTTRHTAFLEDYARFAIEQEDYVLAQRVLKRGFHKTINMSTIVLAELYEQRSQEKYDTEHAATTFSLSQGQIIEFEEFRRQLAETRKIPDTSTRL